MISTVVVTLLLLSVLIFIHELGHFLASKLLKVPVEEFSIGFGPKVFSFKSKETTFKISLIPFGGYVKVFGEDIEGENSFWYRPFYVKFLILISGVLFNFLFGFIIIFLLFFLFGIVESGPYIDEPKEETPAYIAGFKFGDKILKVDGKNFVRWKEFYAVFQDGDTHVVSILRNNRDTLKLKLWGVWNDTVSKFETGILPVLFPVIGEVVPGLPAEKVGFKEKDTIIKINDTNIKKWEEIQSLIEKSGGKKVVVKVKRGGDTLTFEVNPIKINDSYKIGIRADINVLKLPFLKALQHAWEESYFIIYQTFRFIFLFLRGKAPIESFGGPVMIGKVVGETKSKGLSSLLFILAFISINLALINLLPIPALDGGHLLTITVEAILRKRLSFRIRSLIQLIGFALLISISILITILDIHRILK
ncbi:MAG: RIP metalloprotease RseP [Candidatus Hydrothermales bacterium]